MDSFRVAVLSDSHGILRPEVLEIVRKAELALHAGDIADQRTFDRLKAVNKVIAVRGNADGEWAGSLPDEAFFELHGKKIYMVHNRKKASAKMDEADIVIFGHSHKYEEKSNNGRLLLNPGSCGASRFGRPLTMALLEFGAENGDFAVQRVDLSPQSQRNQQGSQDLQEGGACPEFGEGELQETVVAVVGDLKKGKSVDAIIKARKIHRVLVEQICQIYFTHPGIDAQGVLDRMEIAGR